MEVVRPSMDAVRLTEILNSKSQLVTQDQVEATWQRLAGEWDQEGPACRLKAAELDGRMSQLTGRIDLSEKLEGELSRVLIGALFVLVLMKRIFPSSRWATPIGLGGIGGLIGWGFLIWLARSSRDERWQVANEWQALTNEVHPYASGQSWSNVSPFFFRDFGALGRKGQISLPVWVASQVLPRMQYEEAAHAFERLLDTERYEALGGMMPEGAWTHPTIGGLVQHYCEPRDPSSSVTIEALPD